MNDIINDTLTTDAAEAYRRRHAQAQRLLAEIERKLQHHHQRNRNTRHWDAVGDLGHVVEELSEVSRFLGGE